MTPHFTPYYVAPQVMCHRWCLILLLVIELARSEYYFIKIEQIYGIFSHLKFQQQFIAQTISPYNAELFLYKPLKTKVFFQF